MRWLSERVLSMTTDVEQQEKFLAYDGDCPMCRSTVAMLIDWKLIRSEQARGNHELSPTDFETAYAAGMRNELVVIDPETRQVRIGTDGLLWIVRDNTGNHFLVQLLGLPGFRDLLRWGYQIISYNRRIISPPGHQIVCDCEPEVTTARRLSLVVPTFLITAILLALFGASVFRGWELGDALSGAWFAEAAAGAGWLTLTAVGALVLPAGKRLDYCAHLTATMFIGALALLPASLIGFFVPREAAILLDSLSLLTSFWLMFRMQRRRVAALALSRSWLWAWAMVVLIGVGATSYFYFWRDSF